MRRGRVRGLKIAERALWEEYGVPIRTKIGKHYTQY